MKHREMLQNWNVICCPLVTTNIAVYSLNKGAPICSHWLDNVLKTVSSVTAGIAHLGPGTDTLQYRRYYVNHYVERGGRIIMILVWNKTDYDTQTLGS